MTRNIEFFTHFPFLILIGLRAISLEQHDYIQASFCLVFYYIIYRVSTYRQNDALKQAAFRHLLDFSPGLITQEKV